MVVDDEALVRSGFELILGASEDIEVVATASGGDAVETVRRERPDVVLLDIRMPDVAGVTVLRELRTGPDAPVVAHLVRTLAAGGVMLSPEASRTLLHGHPGTQAAVDEEAARVRLLTARERDVLVLVAEGLSNADIGARIHTNTGRRRPTDEACTRRVAAGSHEGRPAPPGAPAFEGDGAEKRSTSPTS
ncbi:response regulator transcription factor [Streptomyces iakyrus]|uniref:response regulator transcription factor n=1 Tax=Streptomyces iakyrus TaxID=68219 RepID=UPI0036FED5A6